MDKLLEKIKTMDLASPAQLNAIRTVEKKYKVSLPQDYVDFMLLHNGGEGPVGEYGYLAIWGTDEILEFLSASGITDAVTGFVFFASDRSGYLYAFDYRSTKIKIVEIPDDIRNSADIKLVAETFYDFICYIYDIDDSDYEEILRKGEEN